MVEWLKATGCKPVDLRVYAGSNPAPSKFAFALIMQRFSAPSGAFAAGVENLFIMWGGLRSL